MFVYYYYEKYMQRIKEKEKWFKDQKKNFLLMCLTVVGSRSYVSPSAMEKSKLRSSLGRKCLCVDWFYLWKWFGRAWTKKFAWLEKERTRTWAMISILRKKSECTWAWKSLFGGLKLILNGGRISEESEMSTSFPNIWGSVGCLPNFSFFTRMENVLLFFWYF